MQKPIVTFSKAYHGGKAILLIGFKYNHVLKEYVKKFEGVKWSTSLRSFYLDFDKGTTNLFFKYLRRERYFVDYSALKVKKEYKNGDDQRKKVSIGLDLSSHVKDEIKKFSSWMAQKRYSTNTINTYESMLLLFFRFQHPSGIDDIGKNEVLKFNTEYIMANGFSYTYQNQAINALKLFFRQRGNTTMLTEDLERPKKSKKLPEVLSIDEVKSILANTPNLKHKTLLSLLYSCGLRIGEAIKLCLVDIDMNRRFMHIKSAKGGKDRYVPMPELMVSLLKKYFDTYKPKHFVFEGQKGGHYSDVSARQVLKRSLMKTGIEKSITLHTLRHSHATHLLENGTDLRFIQELLGHNSPKTTMIYTHVSTTSLDKIKNPFDDFEL